MRKMLFILFLLEAMGSAAQEAAPPKAEAPKVSPLGRQIQQLAFPAITWKIPELGKEIKREVLKNGLVVYLYPDHALPIVNISLVVKGGSLYEAASESLLSEFMGTFLTMGGTRDLTYEQLTEELETRAADLYVWMGSETGSVSARSLKEHFPRMLELLRDVTVAPAFREDKMDLIKKQQKESILRQKDYPGWVIDTLFSSQIYQDHPFGRIARVARVDAIGRDEVLKAHRRLLVPNRSYLGISGDISERETLTMIKKLFGEWKPGGDPLPPLQRVREDYTPGTYFFEKDIPQTNIRLGHLGTKRPNPDESALWVMNAILGGESFKSRLDTRVRSDEGLAYSVGSWFGTSGLEPSTFECYSETKNEKAFRTVTIMKEVIAEMREKPPTGEELSQAKETMINSFINRWTNCRYALSQIMGLEISDRPKTYYKDYLTNLEKVTAADVHAVARKYLKPDKVVVMLVGKRSEMKDLPADIDMREVTLPPEYMEKQ
jgi:predicted Zn-dependent peptidase